MEYLVVVDCQHDFIDGSLACVYSREAVRYLVDFINTHDVAVAYTSDWHSPANRSFKENGGIWPVHCVAGTHGASLAEEFIKDVADVSQRPCGKTLFLKGLDDEVEEYSAFGGKNEEGTVLSSVVSSHVYVGGIASEYCVRETVLDLLAAGHTVTLLAEGLGYVDAGGHRKNLEDLRRKGVQIE